MVLGLLRYWPKTNGNKELMFVAELEEILEAIHPEIFQLVIPPLFRQLGRCISSPHYQVRAPSIPNPTLPNASQTLPYFSRVRADWGPRCPAFL